MPDALIIVYPICAKRTYYKSSLRVLKKEGMAKQAESASMDIEQITLDTLKALVESLTSAANDLVISAFRSVMTKSTIRRNISKGIMPYIYAAGFLSYAGREINEQNLAKAVSSIGLQPDQKMIKAFIASGITSHVMYVYAYYYLLAEGQQPTVENIIKIAASFDFPTDAERIKKALSAIEKYR